MYIYYATNIILDVYISFCVLCTLHETACIIEKNGVEYKLSRVENKKKSYSTEYILSCVDGGDLRIFSVEDVLNTWVENWGLVPYSVGGGKAW